jgi:hypothetical protein
MKFNICRTMIIDPLLVKLTVLTVIENYLVILYYVPNVSKYENLSVLLDCKFYFYHHANYICFLKLKILGFMQYFVLCLPSSILITYINYIYFKIV